MPKKKRSSVAAHLKSKKAAKIRKRKYRAKQRWESTIRDFDEFAEAIKSPKGKSRTFEENKLILMALRAYAKRKFKGTEDKR